MTFGDVLRGLFGSRRLAPVMPPTRPPPAPPAQQRVPMIWDRQTVPQAALTLVREIEGFRAKPYLDGYGFWSIGYGNRWDAGGKPITADSRPVAVQEAEALMRLAMAGARAHVAEVVPGTLLQREAAALISLAYNLGDLQQKAPTLLRLVNGRQAGIARQFAAYRMSAGRPSLGLVRRRWAEAGLWVGMMPEEAKRQAWARIATLEDWPPHPVAEVAET